MVVQDSKFLTFYLKNCEEKIFFPLRGFHFQQLLCFCNERTPRRRQCTRIVCTCKMYTLQQLFLDRSRRCRFSTLHRTVLGSSSVTPVTNLPRGLTPSTDKRFILTPERPDLLWGPPRFCRSRTECCFMGGKRPECQAYSRQSNAKFKTERTYTCSTSHTDMVCNKTPPSVYWPVLWPVPSYCKTCVMSRVLVMVMWAREDFCCNVKVARIKSCISFVTWRLAAHVNNLLLMWDSRLDY